MTLLNGFQHLTFVTADMDRLIAFYKNVFDAQVSLDLQEGPIRHAFIEVGANAVLHPFELPDINPPDTTLPMFQRGRLDHFALHAASEDAFRELHRRVMAEGRDDGEVTDMGVLLLFSFTDPDEGRHEVVWWKPIGNMEGVRREDWKRVEMD